MTASLDLTHISNFSRSEASPGIYSAAYQQSTISQGAQGFIGSFVMLNSWTCDKGEAFQDQVGLIKFHRIVFSLYSSFVKQGSTLE